jgi:hypothetical protein
MRADSALQAAEKLELGLSFEGYGLQPVHKANKINGALAPEGRILASLPQTRPFSAACLAAGLVP